MRNVYGRTFLFSAVLALLCACREAPEKGPVKVTLIRPTGERCRYAVVPTTLRTVEDLSKMRGKIGGVVTAGLSLDASPDVLDRGVGFSPVDAQFLKSGDAYAPRNYATLFAASVYGAIETGYLLHARLNPAAEFATTVPDFAARTVMVINAPRRVRRRDGRLVPETDNAEYLAHQFPGKKGAIESRNYIVTYPLQTLKDMPLGLNLGIMVHEYTHLVFQHLFYEPAAALGTGVAGEKPTLATLSSVNEGIADYFGYLATGDPAFFLCSFPGQNRDLSVPKPLTPDLAARIATDGAYDPHEGGAVFAAINYEIGRSIGFERNAVLLQKLMAGLLTCRATQAAGSTNSLDLDLSAVAECHGSLDAERSGTISKIYEKYNVRTVQGDGT